MYEQAVLDKYLQFLEVLLSGVHQAPGDLAASKYDVTQGQ